MSERTLPKQVGKGKQRAGKKTANKSPMHLLYDCQDAAVACGVSPKTWRSWNLLGFVPQPVKIGKTFFWRVDELAKWIEADCPCRDEWSYRPGKNRLENICPFSR